MAEMEDTGLGEEIQADEDVQKYSGTASDPAGEGNTGTTLRNSPEPSNLSLSAKIEFFNKLRDQKISCEATEDQLNDMEVEEKEIKDKESKDPPPDSPAKDSRASIECHSGPLPARLDTHKLANIDPSSDITAFKLLHVDDEGRIKIFRSYREISDYLNAAAITERKLDKDLEEHLWKLMSAPLSQFVHFFNMGDYLKHLYDNKKFIDVTVEVEQRKFCTHRAALSCHSGYFKELFEHTEKKLPISIRLKGVRAEAFAAFLRYIYTSVIEVTPETACDLILLADYLQVEALRRKFDSIAWRIPLKRALSHLKTGRANISDDLYNAFIQMVITQFDEIMKGSDFLEMDVDAFCEVLSSDDLFVKNETEVFAAVIRWLCHDENERIKFAVRVFSHVRYMYMPVESLVTCAESAKLLGGFDQLRELILISNWLLTNKSLQRKDPFDFPLKPPRKHYGFSNPVVLPTGNALQLIKDNSRPKEDKKPVDDSLEFCPKFASTPKPCGNSNLQQFFPPATESGAVFQSKPTEFLVIGGFNTSCDEDTGYNSGVSLPPECSPQVQQVIHLCALPEPRQHHGLAEFDGAVYLVGGNDPRMECTMPSRKVFKLSIATKRWERVTDMNYPRMSHCVCSHRGMLYAIGGIGDTGRITNTVECYNPTKGQWQLVSPLLVARSAACAASYDGMIYVTGGLREKTSKRGQTRILKSVEVYDSSNNTWTKKGTLRFPRCDSGLVQVDNRLFLCGGLALTTGSPVPVSVSSVDEYLPEKDAWLHRTNMFIPRQNAAVTASDCRIIIMGGVSLPIDHVLRSIECYDVNKDMWSSGEHDLPYDARWIGCAVVPSN